MPSFLMCQPLYYGIEYEINPWMSRLRPADSAAAALQWQGLLHTLRDDLGLSVEVMEPAQGMPDLVFAANAGLVLGKKFVRSNFRYQERAREEPVWQEWFAKRGYDIHVLPPETKFEGEGDALIMDGVIHAGWRFRSHLSSHAALTEALGLPAVSLQLVDPYFYHVDTCFAPLGGGKVMYFPGAFDSASRALIEGAFSQRLAVPESEARRFVCNAVVVDKTIVSSKDCPETAKGLAAWGYKLIGLETSEFIKAGGSAKCMVLTLKRDGEGG